MVPESSAWLSVLACSEADLCVPIALLVTADDGWNGRDGKVVRNICKSPGTCCAMAEVWPGGWTVWEGAGELHGWVMCYVCSLSSAPQGAVLFLSWYVHFWVWKEEVAVFLVFSAGEPLLTVLPWWKVTFWARECGMHCTQVVCLIQGHVSARKPTCLNAWGWGPSRRSSPKNQLAEVEGGWCWQDPWLWHSNWENRRDG